MKLNLISIFTLLACLWTGLADAQVTIGSDETPLAGALLDLKEKGTTTKGLGLPRVELLAKKIGGSTYTNLSKTIKGAKGTWNASDHTGLMVYNIVGKTDKCDSNLDVSEGVYIWTGLQWQNLGGENKRNPEVYSFTDARDGEVYLARHFGNGGTDDAGDWMVENLRYIPKTTDGFTHSVAASNTDKHFIYPEGDEKPYNPSNHPSSLWFSLHKKNGLFYNWAAAIDGYNDYNGGQGQGQGDNDELAVGVRGICPENWHVPSDVEWNTLERYMYKNGHLYSSYSQAEVEAANTLLPWNPLWETDTVYRPDHDEVGDYGQCIVMRYSCPTFGTDTDNDGKSLSAEAGGFAAQLTGFINPNDGELHASGRFGNYWTSSAIHSHAWGRYFGKFPKGVHRELHNQYSFAAIRCKKD